MIIIRIQTRLTYVASGCQQPLQYRNIIHLGMTLAYAKSMPPVYLYKYKLLIIRDVLYNGFIETTLC